MSVDRLINMVIRRLSRRLMNRGIDAGIDLATRRSGKDGPDSRKTGAGRAQDARALAQKARKGARLIRRIGRF